VTDTVVATGQRWALRNGGASYAVVAIGEDGTVALSGPGPCRMMKYLSVDELERDFVLLKVSKAVEPSR
jgi:hypothetical protein